MLATQKHNLQTYQKQVVREISKERQYAMIELMAISDMLMDALDDNRVIKVKDAVNNFVKPYIESTLELITTDRMFSNKTTLQNIAIVVNNLINHELNLEKNHVGIGCLCLLNVMEQARMNSTSSVLVRKAIIEDILPHYQKQIDKIFSNAKYPLPNWKRDLHHKTQTRIRIALKNEKIKL